MIHAKLKQTWPSNCTLFTLNSFCKKIMHTGDKVLMLATVDMGTREVAVCPKYLPTNWKILSGNTVSSTCFVGLVKIFLWYLGWELSWYCGNVPSGNLLWKPIDPFAIIQHSAASNAVYANWNSPKNNGKGWTVKIFFVTCEANDEMMYQHRQSNIIWKYPCRSPCISNTSYLSSIAVNDTDISRCILKIKTFRERTMMFSKVEFK